VSVIAIGAEQEVDAQQRQTAYVMLIKKKRVLAHRNVHRLRPIVVGVPKCRFWAILPLAMASANAALDPAGVGASGFGVLGHCMGNWGRCVSQDRSLVLGGGGRALGPHVGSHRAGLLW